MIFSIRVNFDHCVSVLIKFVNNKFIFRKIAWKPDEWNQNGEKSLEKTGNYLLATMKSLRKMGLNFQFVKCLTRKDVNSKNIIGSFGIKIPEIIWRNITILASFHFFCFIIPTPSWPSKLNSDWFFCRLRQWGVWRITWQILSSFLTVFFEWLSMTHQSTDSARKSINVVVILGFCKVKRIRTKVTLIRAQSCKDL